MRDGSSWRAALESQLKQSAFPEGIMPRAAFCQVELGLHFLTTYFPGEPVGALQPLLSGYVRASDDLEVVARHVRHRMGDVARRGYWRRLLNLYTRVPAQWRAFERTDDPARRVSDETVFVVKPTSYCTERHDAYANATTDRLEYRPAPRYRPAPAGKRYLLTLSGDRSEHIELPADLPVSAPLENLPTVPERAREPWNVSLKTDLEPTARQIDEKLAARPDITNRNWVKRLTRDMRFAGVDPSTGDLVDRPEQFVIDGVAHVVGLMNSGKTTLADLLTVNRVEEHGDRVGLVVGSVGDVFAKVSFLRALGINAVPLIGHSSRGEHVGRYWRTAVEDPTALFPDGPVTPDPAAAYANASCLLEPFRKSSNRQWAPLGPDDFPCRGRLRETDTERPGTYDCPLLTVCPAQKAYREIATAQVWVTTPQCLVASRAEPAEAAMRWFEAAQHHLDLLIIDEADAVQQVFDTRFVQTENLVARGKGWSHRMVAHTTEAMADQNMAPAADAEVARWHALLQTHDHAVFALNRLALTPDGQPLEDLLGEAPFTSHSLFRQVAGALYGVPRRGEEGQKASEDLADEFYRTHLQDLAENPSAARGHGLEHVMSELTGRYRDDDAVVAALDAWIDTNVSRTHVASDKLERVRPMLRFTTEAAVWAGQITTTFFEMTTMYPSVHKKLKLPDEETFWADQPPRDYRPLVPEAPMGNILALRWAPHRNGGSSLQLLWVHGIGRWLLHHAHDLLACEGVQGLHVILTSATSWAPGSSFYHVPITPTIVLRQPDEDRDALLTSTMEVRPMKAGADPIFVSGKAGQERHDALRQMVTALCLPSGGRPRSVLDELRADLPEDRQKILFTVLSGKEARIAGEHLNTRVPQLTARVVVPDAAGPDTDGIRRRLVGRFGKGTDDVLVAAEMSIQRGYNILNINDTAALGAVVYLTRSHPPPFDLAFPLSLVSQLAMEHLRDAPLAEPGQVGEVARQIRGEARRLWFDVIGRPVQFRALEDRYRTAFVANTLIPMSQTIGRSIRGNQPTKVLLCDSAFAPRYATGDSAGDTLRTSIVVAMDHYLTDLLASPDDSADAEDQRLHAINEAVWGLMGHLVRTSKPLGSERKGAC